MRVTSICHEQKKQEHFLHDVVAFFLRMSWLCQLARLYSFKIATTAPFYHTNGISAGQRLNDATAAKGRSVRM
jgi:hypothetical protein